MQKRLKFAEALWTIALSIILFSGIPAGIIFGFRYHQKSRRENNQFVISKLVQTGPVKEALKSEHLEELLALSIDHPKNIYSFDLKEARQRLLNSGVIEEAHLFIEFPDTLVVDYIAREPIAYISDYQNLVVDRHGTFFPLTPFYTPKILPNIYLGMKLSQLNYGTQIGDEKLKVALEIFQYFQERNFSKQKIKTIDVSQFRANSLGKQEIVVHLFEELGKKDYQRYLRLSPTNYLEELDHYISLKQMSMVEDFIVDLRLLPNAYLTPIKEEMANNNH